MGLVGSRSSGPEIDGLDVITRRLAPRSTWYELYLWQSE
jgi:hypothetical protein